MSNHFSAAHLRFPGDDTLTPRHLSPHAHPATDLRPIDAPHSERVEGGCAEWAPKLLGLPPERRRLRRSLRYVDPDHAALTGRLRCRIRLEIRSRTPPRGSADAAGGLCSGLACLLGWAGPAACCAREADSGPATNRP